MELDNGIDGVTFLFSAVSITSFTFSIVGSFEVSVADTPLGLFTFDIADTTQFYEGTNQICRMVMGRQILN